MSFPCCEHCAEDKIHDVPMDEHDLSCTICDGDLRAPVIVAARDRDEARAERDAALATIVRVKALHGIQSFGNVCAEDSQPYPCPTIKALGGPS